MNKSNYRALLVLLAIMTLGALITPSSAHALTLSPTRFEISGNPGDTLTGEMTVINENDGAETYYSSYANFEAEGETGTPSFVEPKDDLGTWITTDSSVSLSPHQQKVVPFKVVIPKDAEPGGHFAVIFWGTSPAGQGQVSIGAKTGILVLLSVSGDVKEEAGLLNFNTQNKTFWYKTLPVSFEYRFSNGGGDRIKPTGTITIRDTIFWPADRLDANPVEGNVLPNSVRKINVDWIKYERPVDYVEPAGFFSKFWSNTVYEWRNFAVGLYSANFNVTYGTRGERVKKTVFFFVFPWELVLIMLVVFIILFWGGKKLIKRYNKYIIKRARAGIELPLETPHG
ncbi:MAG: hypothetical protein ACREGC_01065 [Minisyncoccia bacterium]